MTKPHVVICPYCGETQAASQRCRACGGLFEPLSRQATHNAMGPWFFRDPAKPFQPGCSYETLLRMIDRGQVTKYSILRGPTTKQYWTVAKHVAGVSHLLGYCHSCDASVDASDHGCHACGVPFGAYLDRNAMGLPELRPLPWEAQLEPGESEGMGAPGSLDSVQLAHAGSISRFAADEELLATPAGAPRIDRRGGVDETRFADDGGKEAESVFDEYTSSAVTRALRRKIDGQRRTSRLLTIMLIVGFVIVVGIGIGPLAATLRSSGSPAPDEQRSAESTAEDEAGSPDAPNLPTAPQEEAHPDPPIDAGSPTEAPASAFAAEYDEALQLISSAANADRPLADRIGDLERAQQILRGIDASAPADERPKGLEETITSIKRELERLRLERDFFG